MRIHFLCGTAIFVSLLVPFASAQQDVLDLADRWKFMPDPENAGVKEGWHAPDFDASAWPSIKAGARWEDQGYRDLDGFAWYRAGIEIPVTWKDKPALFLTGGVNDACVLFCNGKQVAAFGDDRSRTMYQTPVIADLSAYIVAGASNVIAVQVFDWGGNGGLWRRPCILTTDFTQLPTGKLVALRIDTAAQQLIVDVDPEIGKALFASPVRVAVETSDAPSRQVSAEMGKTAAMDMRGVAADSSHRVLMSAELLGGLRAEWSSAIEWMRSPSWGGEFSSLRVLNNFVTELYSGPRIARDSEIVPFDNPRDGWVLIAVSKEGRAGRPEARIDSETAPLVWRAHPQRGDLEAMRLLTKGRHQLTLTGAWHAGLAIRTVPELAFCSYAFTPHVTEFGPYDHDYMTKHVLSEVNTLISGAPIMDKDASGAQGELTRQFFDQWRREGRQWLSTGGVVGLKAPAPPDPREVVKAWIENVAFRREGYAGLIVDEFTSETDAHYAAWTEAVALLCNHPEFRDRKLYAWCVDLFRDPGPIAFSRQLLAHDQYFSWEMYLREEPTEEIAARWINQHMAQGLSEWSGLVPEVERNMIMCLGYFSAPPETLDVDPSVNYLVFLDMQFHALANDPAFWRLRGVMEYLSNYADEEYLRYAHSLIRHYCIEGRRDRFNRDPYALAHVVNPDFSDGLDGWTIEPAAEGSIHHGEMDGFSFLEGRYPRYPEGDTFCVLRATGEKPNSVSQTLRSLEPGRLYSLKMYSANLDNLDRNLPTPLSIRLDGVEELPEFAFDFVFPSSYAHVVPPYDSRNPAHMTFHRRVFRALGDNGSLFVGDFRKDVADAIEPGHRTVFNFVQIQPFFAP